MILHRLLLREIGVPLLLSLLLVSQMLVVMQMLQLNEVLFGSGFDAMGVLRIASYLAPHFGVVALPLAFLLAIMLGLGRLNEDNEIIALSALGRSPFVLYLVPLGLSVALGGVVGALAFQAEPWGLRGIHKQLNELIKRNVAGDVRPGIFNEDIPRFTLFVGGTATNRGDWTHVLLHDASEEGAPMLLLSQQGKVESDGADALLRLNLRDGELHRAMKDGTYTHGQFDQASIALGVSNFLNRNRFIRPAGELPFGALRRAATSARANHQDAEARVLETAYYARIAALFTCVIFGLIAVPLAIGGRGARGRSFAATVLAFATYYVVQTVANGMGEGGRVTPLVAAWIPNVIGLLVAMALAWRLRHGQQAARR